MTDPRTTSKRPPEDPDLGAGLRLRLWLGCLGGVLAVAAALWWAIAVQPRAAAGLPAELLWVWLPAIAGGGVVLGAILAIWLDRAIVGHLRGLIRSMAAGKVAELRGLPCASGWGELSELTQQAQILLSRHRLAARSVAELEQLQRQLEQVQDALARWARTEEWQVLSVGPGPLGDVAQLLNRAMVREGEVREQNREAARQVQGELVAALGDARETAEQAERGFVEATALLTTVRELQRLAVELQQTVAAPPPGGESAWAVSGVRGWVEAWERARAAAVTAIEELVAASSGSISHLASGMMKVQEISELVQLLTNRATLIALNVVAAGRPERGGAREGELAEQLKVLAREVRQATERTTALTHELEREVTAAGERMHGVRTRVAERLGSLPAPEVEIEAGAPPDEVVRLLERVREMIQDATRKGERLSAAGERASSAAERLVKTLEDETREMEGIVVRFGAVGEEPVAPAAEGEPGATAEPAGPAGRLRLLDADDVSDDESGTRGREERS